ncbi:acetate kinase [Sulfurimonas marina]|uniref:Acetate kinase n=1 Tax=Sulfurimonas marina TaxID=2590551 RepID=A0A7M1AW96_9BACT|nr:acetate kinase [Sulfurimonas marina]QOP41729.1 acetate kinase [Sulfurimonas marina]
MKIAVVNSGSSSLKFKLLKFPQGTVLEEKLVEHIGEEHSDIKDHHQALEALAIDFSEIDVIGHRVVHGGEKFHSTVLIDNEVIRTIRELIPLAPLHNPANLEGIEVMQKFAPNIPQVAVFDTAFHSSLQKEAYMYALPYEMYEKNHIRRYGFHGTSHSYLLKEAAKLLNKEPEKTSLISLHLGNGESICAIQNGKSVDISMGFTPLEGLMMGSRSGDLDAEIVLYMQKSLNLSVEEVDTILNKKSGLIGVCGENDIRTILERNDERAKLAIKMMVRRIHKYIGAYFMLLDTEVDAIVFSGGIGENSQVIRDKILDKAILKNLKSFVIKTDEELEIARECYQIVKKV